MAAIGSTMLELGTEAPPFSLPDTEGVEHSLADSASAYLVMFICNHCPYVIHVRDELARLGRDYAGKDVAMYAIMSNDIKQQPADAPDKMKAEAKAQGYAFPYLYDADQSVAKAYRAACTPDFFLFDAERRLVYRGQLDDSRPGNNIPPTGKDLRGAVDALLAGKPVPKEQKASIGCSIKWSSAPR